MSDDRNYLYDVFISYRWVDPDQSWVRHELKPALENAGLEVCLDVDDFLPGRDVILEMTRGGTESRRGLCVLSPDYVNDPDRMVNFESLMLRGMDPSGRSSRLVPFILRSTEIPLHIRNLIPVDWTNATYHQREWSKLLAVLEAKNRDAPPPAPLDPGSTPTPRPKPPRSRIRIPRAVWVSILAVSLLGLFAIIYKYCRRPPPPLITIDGHVFYRQTQGITVLVPVEGVEVSLSQTSDVKPALTDPEGKFILRGVPADTSIDLRAKYGSVYYQMGYEQSGNYAVIPPDVDPVRKFVQTPWADSQEACLPDEGRQAAHSRVFQNNIEFQAEAGKNEARLTVELVDAPETILLSAHVLATPTDSFRNALRPGENRERSHTWKFNLLRSGPRTQLLVCLGSNNSAALSSNKLLTFYTLH